MEQCVDVHAPESVEEIVDELQDFPQERISERILERNEDTPLPPIREEHVKVVKLDTQECVQQRTDVGWTGQQEDACGHVRVF